MRGCRDSWRTAPRGVGRGAGEEGRSELLFVKEIQMTVFLSRVV